MMSLDASPNAASEALPEESVPPAALQIPSPWLPQFLLLSQQITSPRATPNAAEFSTTIEEEDFNMLADTIPSENDATEQLGPNVPNISITRKSILVLTNVLEKMPPSFLESPEAETGPEFSISVVENIFIPFSTCQPQELAHPLLVTPSRGLENDLDELPAFRNKRQRPRYSFKGSKLRKHPVLNFLATGPVDREKLHTSGGVVYAGSNFL